MNYVYKENSVMIFYVFLNSHLVYDSNMLILKTIGRLGVDCLISHVFGLILLEGKQRLSVGLFDKLKIIVF